MTTIEKEYITGQHLVEVTGGREMKIILEDIPENTEIKISCNSNQPQDISSNPERSINNILQEFNKKLEKSCGKSIV